MNSRIKAVVVAGMASVAIAGCGGSNWTNASQPRPNCAKAIQDARSWANDYVQRWSSADDQKTIDDLAESEYKLAIAADPKLATCRG